MIKTSKLFFLCGVVSALCVQASEHVPLETVVIKQTDAVVKPMKLFLGVYDTSGSTQACSEFIAQLKHCLEWSGRFVVSVQRLESLPKRKSGIQKLFKEAYDCAFFITYNGPEKPLEWRLYDTAVATMIKGKKMQASANVIATEFLYELTNEPQVFRSKIVYRKKEAKKDKSSLWVTDFDGSHPKMILQSRRILVAPRWCNDSAYPALLFSEFTPSNVRLMMTDMQGRTAPVVDVDGTTVGVSYAPNCDDVAYCHSGDIWHYHHDKASKRGIHKKIIHEADVCACPILLKDGNIIYCSRGAIKLYNAQTQEQSVIIGQGYCVAPAYSDVNNKIAYSKRVDGQMQLFVYDWSNGIHTQVTFSSPKISSSDYRSNKLDPCWAPDGIHLVFCWERKDQSRIAILNTLTKEYTFITDENEHCSYPAWSKNFDV